MPVLLGCRPSATLISSFYRRIYFSSCSARALKVSSQQASGLKKLHGVGVSAGQGKLGKVGELCGHGKVGENIIFEVRGNDLGSCRLQILICDFFGFLKNQTNLRFPLKVQNLEVFQLRGGGAKLP